MASIFSDGFESGNGSAWSSSSVSGSGASITYSGTAARSGSYGAIAAGTTGGQNWTAFLTKSFTAPSSNIFHVRAYINIQADNDGGGLRVLRLNGSSLFNLFRLSNYYGTWRAYLRKKDGNTEETDLSSGVPASQWARIDVLYDISGTNPVLKVWVDSTEVVNFTDTTSGSTGMPNEIQIGGAEESWSQTATTWVDDVDLWDDAANVPGSVTNKDGSDTFTLSETGALTAALSGTDTGTATDVAGIARTVSDSATLTDGAALGVTGSDTATATGAGALTAALSGTDTGTATDVAGMARTVSDSITATDSATLTVSHSGTDSAVVRETLTALTPGSSAPTPAGAVVNSYTSTTSSPSATMPANIPVGARIYTYIVADSGSNLTITPPGAFTLAERHSVGTSTIVHAIYERVADGTEAASYSYTFGTAVVCDLITFYVTGLNSSPVDVAATKNSANSTTPTATGLTTLTDNDIVLTFFAIASGSSNPTTPTGFTSISGGNGGRSWRVAYQIKTPAGSVSNAASSIAASRNWGAMMWALKPAPAGTPALYTSDGGTATDSAALSLSVSGSDTATATDGATLATALAGSDTATATDASSADTGSTPKGDADTATATDDLTALARDISDTATATDDLTALAREVSDSATLTDEATLATALAGSDTATATDGLTALARDISDTASATDGATLGTPKDDADTATAADDLTALARAISDAFTAADDLTALARDISDTGTATDGATLTVSFVLADTAGTVDVADTAREVSDSITTTEGADLEVSFVLTDTASTTEAAGSGAVLVALDAFAGVDLGGANAALEDYDAGVMVDASALFAALAGVDGLTAGDASAIEIGLQKSGADTASATEGSAVERRTVQRLRGTLTERDTRGTLTERDTRGRFIPRDTRGGF